MTSRKEIAARLREAGKDNNDWSMGTNAAFFKIDDIIGAQYKSYGFFFSRLADLIDPTCEGIHRREPDDIDGTPRYTIHCSNCGQLLNETSGIPHSPMYCHNCGTRIIRGRLYSQSEDSSEVVQD